MEQEGRMSGMDAWHLIAPLIAAHSVSEHNGNGRYELNALDEAYLVVFWALKEYDERRKEKSK